MYQITDSDRINLSPRPGVKSASKPGKSRRKRVGSRPRKGGNR
jgi:hypothetical protein